jgi:hypothetical protein
MVLAGSAAAWLLATAASAAPLRIPSQPTPTGPVSAGIPGALPAGFHYRYRGLSPGWPVQPRGVQHPIRGAFIDPRGADDNGLSGYHFGIDINVDDAHPDAGAPHGLSHAVYALDAGWVSTPAGNAGKRCLDQRIEVGQFAYWHVSSILPQGRRVRAGQQIGWTCAGVWHVHLSEWQLFRGRRVWVNPLHKGGPLVPYVETSPPLIQGLQFVSPPSRAWRPVKSLVQSDNAARLAPSSLHGLVELRAQIADPQSFVGFLARNSAWPTQWTPYRISVDVRSASTGAVVLHRTSFQADQMPQTPYLVHYAPGTVEDDNMRECVGPPALKTCDGTTWLRPFSRFRQEYWNTRASPNGSYRVTVRTWDIAGNEASKTLVVTVKN